MTFYTLQDPLRSLFLLHILGGGLALGILLLPLWAKKGGRLHVRSGWVYIIAMGAVAVTAVFVTFWRAFLDAARTTLSVSFALFLFLISLFTVSLIVYGLQPLHAKKRTTPDRSPSKLGLPFLLVAVSLFTQGMGIYLGNGLLILFPFLVLGSAASQIKYWWNAPTQKMHWWYAHMNGMFGSCIATITAFLVTAAPRIWPTPLMKGPVPWIAPGLILGAFLNRWIRRYQRQFGD